MLRKSKIASLGAVCLFSISFLIQAQTPVSGFYPEKNNLTVAPSYTYKSYDQFYRGSTLTEAAPANMGTISSSIASIYGEYGIIDWLSTTITIPYISITNSEGIADPVLGTDKVDGVQDLSVFLKARAFNKQFANSSKLSIGAATGLTVPLSNYEAAGILSIGNRATAIDGCGIVQYSTPINIFAEALFGYSMRENSDFEIPNALVYSLKVGYYNDWIYAHAKLGVQDSTSGYDIASPEFTANGGPAGLPQTEVDYTNLYFDVYTPIYKKSLGISAGYGVNLNGRNYNQESSITFGLVYKAN